ncbi:DUF3419 family protein [Flavobacteriaceae bacterium SZ-1-7]|uniref:DUF3419 family protein n=1 Tax=Tamlana sedimenti TaxID=3134126 RepID=UPI003129D3B5
MAYLYDFGISQDDPQVEQKALNLENSNLLCIASAGEVPLSILAQYNTQITAVDISINQIRLCKLKLIAALNLKSKEAAEFLGFKKTDRNTRIKYFNKLIPYMSEEDFTFWNQHKKSIVKGVIGCSRFEKYISFFCSCLRFFIGKDKIMGYFDLEYFDEQKDYFKTHLEKKFIKKLFHIAFSPRLYKNRGLDEQALIHHEGKIADKFYSKFQDFFIATPCRKNFYLQYYLLGEVKFEEAYPTYLQDHLHENLIKHQGNITFKVKSVSEEIMEHEELHFKNYALSNICDWMEEKEMNNLIDVIHKKSKVKPTVFLRYIHKNPINENLCKAMIPNEEFDGQTTNVDRFPFYSAVQLKTS